MTNPIIVRESRNEVQTAEDRQERQDQRINRWATLGLSVLTTLVLIFQLKLLGKQNTIISGQTAIMKQQADYMRDGLAETKKAADAASDSAAAAKDSAESARSEVRFTHRPRIVIRSISIDGWGPRRVTNVIKGTLRAVNVGPTDAEIRFVNWRWLIDKWLPMGNPMHLTVTPPDSPRGPIPSTAMMKIDMEGFIISDADMKSILSGEKNLYLIGYIKYGRFDVLGLRRTYFGRRFDVELGRFQIEDNPDYEYED